MKHHGGGGRRCKLLLTDEKAGADAHHHSRRDNLAGLTLFAVLGGDEVSPAPAPAPAPAQQTRTLLDVIKDDSNGSGGKDNKKTWKHFKEKLRLKPSAGAAWTSTVPIPASDVPMNNRSMSRRHSTRFAEAEYPATGEYKPELSVSASRRELRSTPSSRMSLARNQSRTGDRSLKLQSSMSIRRGGEEESEREGGEEGEGDQPMRMSLMALLAESEEGGYVMDEEEEEGGCEDYGGEFNNCCVCMVRHKGEPFEPCGHTFCRLCSRELWAEKGNCPLCNNFILEILDIF